MPRKLPVHSRPSKGGRYWICYVRTPDGERHQRALHIRDDGTRESERAAIAAYWNEQARATAGDLDRKRSARSLKSALAALATKQDLAELSEHSHLRTKRCARWLCRHFGAERDIATITAEDLVTYATAAKGARAAVTVDEELRTYSLACGACGIEPAKVPDVGDKAAKPQEPFSLDEVRRFLVACLPKQRWRLLAHQLHFMGLRASETRKLDEPDWANQRVWCNGTKTKKSKRWVPIPDEMFEYMCELRARNEWIGWPVVPNPSIYQFVARTSIRAGIGRRSPNDCRGGLATRLAGNGVPAAMRGALMGNSERMQEATYSQPHLLEDELASAMNRQPRITKRQPPCIVRASANAGPMPNTAPPVAIGTVKSQAKPDEND